MDQRFFSVTSEGAWLYSRLYVRRWEAERDATSEEGSLVRDIPVTFARFNRDKVNHFKTFVKDLGWAIPAPANWALAAVCYRSKTVKDWKRLKFAAATRWHHSDEDVLCPPRLGHVRPVGYPTVYVTVRGWRPGRSGEDDWGIALFECERDLVVSKVAGLPVVKHVVQP